MIGGGGHWLNVYARDLYLDLHYLSNTTRNISKQSLKCVFPVIMAKVGLEGAADPSAFLIKPDKLASMRFSL